MGAPSYVTVVLTIAFLSSLALPEPFLQPGYCRPRERTEMAYCEQLRII